MFARISRTVPAARVAPLVAALVAVVRIAGGVALTAEPLNLPAAAAVGGTASPQARNTEATADSKAGKDAKAGENPKADADRTSPRCRGLIPVCRRVPLKVKKPHVEYSMKCELVCVPGCGCLSHGGACGHCTHCAERKGGCGDVRIRQKKLLLKKVTDKEHESYEYKIFWVCPACAGLGGRCAATTCTDHPDAQPRFAARTEPGLQSHTRDGSAEPRLADRLLEWLPPLR